MSKFEVARTPGGVQGSCPQCGFSIEYTYPRQVENSLRKHVAKEHK